MISEDMDYLITTNKVKPVKDFYPKMSKKALIHLYELVMQKKVLGENYSKKELSDIVFSLVSRQIDLNTLPYSEYIINSNNGIKTDKKGNCYYHIGICDVFGLEGFSVCDIPISLNVNSKQIKRCINLQLI